MTRIEIKHLLEKLRELIVDKYVINFYSNRKWGSKS